MGSRLAISWERRYAAGRDSGAGSRGEHAERKAAYVNALIAREKIGSVIDWGCGDGMQLALLKVPTRYVGIDVSPTAIALCRARFPNRKFILDKLDQPPLHLKAELALSLDVMFHLVKISDLRRYLRSLFRSATRFVCVYGTDEERRQTAPHVRHRSWTPIVARWFHDWELIDKPAVPAAGMGFYLYRRRPR